MRVFISREVPRRAMWKFFWLILRTIVFVTDCNKRTDGKAETQAGKRVASPACTAPCLIWKVRESCFCGDSG
jgi:hypothetical protein